MNRGNSEFVHNPGDKGRDGSTEEGEPAESRPGAQGGLLPFEMTLIGHLRELRSRLIKSLLSLIPGFALAYSLAGPILKFLAKPLREALPRGSSLVAMALPDTFLVHLKIAFWGGFFLASPFWLYQLWSFVAPGLYGKEKRGLKTLSFLGGILLLAGAAFAYYVIVPIAFKFLVTFGEGGVTLLPAVRPYLSLIINLLVVFGLTFQLPLALMLLASLGLVNAAKLKAFRRYAILLAFILAAVLTPPDIISQILLALPLVALYEFSVFLIGRSSQGQDKAGADNR